MRRDNRSQEPKEFEERVVQVRRVTKVVSGGKRLGFRVLTVIGDKKGRVGMGLGKASEVVSAIRKAMDAAKKELITIPMIGGTIPHETRGKLGASSVVIRPAATGTGVIAGGSVRVVLELAGVRDAVAKSIGSSNAVNVARATISALLNLREQEHIEALRGKKMHIKYMQEKVNV
ncbi:30S ribosomal protein S5 [candidate division WOR-1 bacterium RIFOXYA12_FULL_43_27]|uniref:Small ribosomal subunit protein uS5 n=1 Tax=candidate division WOR-1 bacterium RIFOXYC2_FULL_46_14 TaxID=1802587 RepID=A0A1F4U6A4_UNCSA|nr:MAG: 30S ribosomal protein S5 [candidate division WOR-1 bacterium RIFOXYA12_FULL_43_27]OGC20942.1 MAG: 30S ribosomal protein S5 [candidate division WOR-1 bacterium RIFOXYB2_FULL_46_45]OGC32298.1 MAG: 30S ribosomal protein S5 [candidate division WOR-1 bacterium RIFOXYA2_FULL_46_56]OGC40498.1 MAG: 30S ribosomal protein S5 [candidate division WOR-1 bacterium RIFOXYC2_FULL_46_14]